MNFKAWVRKRKWDILFAIFIGLMLIPSVRMPVMAFVQRVFAGSPSTLAVKDQKEISSSDWVLIDLEGNQTNLSAASGKVTIVNSWATWCPPCVAEMPSLQKLYDKYQNQVAFYFVSNESPETLKRFLKSKNYNLPVYMPASNYPKEFDSNSLPTTYVLDQNGTIIMEEVGAHNWFSDSFQEKIEQLLVSPQKE
ncbi:thiol-disulfide oxidoreductase [Brumimicrobium salinarum]|uniref:Thiol-disulfide oxidoreductase n=1 Tax=Brumimicrobium salinarum TaxID=2058658 RepID=A0A2I0R2V4_9FLAO|nr:TlpA disulfide reductase family protein [Brumimicrobium salinarum]PKR80904.1 thiol-disulfide oxidoreductase [Brumimicrobium salinarum]